MPYFHISTGLRGCYMPDSACVIYARSRRVLKATIENEAHMWEGAAGLSKRAIATFAATVWREAQKDRPATLPHCLPVKPEGAGGYSSGVFASVATRREYLDYQASED